MMTAKGPPSPSQLPFSEYKLEFLSLKELFSPLSKISCAKDL